MKEESTAHGVKPEQLRRLLNIGRDMKKPNGRIDDNQHKTEMLYSSLSQTLPLDKSQIDMLPSTLSQLCHSIGLLAGETITELLSNPSTDISSIERIKHYSKKLSAQAESKAEHEVATAIYYASIAHALVYHSERITRFSYEKLEASFTRLVKEKWIPKNLTILFKIASKYCKEKAKS
jgi:hypothetical protein